LEQHRLEKYSEEFDSFGINSIDIFCYFDNNAFLDLFRKRVKNIPPATIVHMRGLAKKYSKENPLILNDKEIIELFQHQNEENEEAETIIQETIQKGTIESIKPSVNEMAAELTRRLKKKDILVSQRFDFYFEDTKEGFLMNLKIDNKITLCKIIRRKESGNSNGP